MYLQTQLMHEGMGSQNSNSFHSERARLAAGMGQWRTAGFFSSCCNCAGQRCTCSEPSCSKGTQKRRHAFFPSRTLSRYDVCSAASWNIQLTLSPYAPLACQLAANNLVKCFVPDLLCLIASMDGARHILVHSSLSVAFVSFVNCNNPLFWTILFHLETRTWCLRLPKNLKGYLASSSHFESLVLNTHGAGLCLTACEA